LYKAGSPAWRIFNNQLKMSNAFWVKMKRLPAQKEKPATSAGIIETFADRTGLEPVPTFVGTATG
jgi:hypothetical protein